MRCYEAISLLLSGDAHVIRHEGWVDTNDFLWIKRGNLVHTIGTTWADSETVDWWDAGIPIDLWNSDRWEVVE